MPVIALYNFDDAGTVAADSAVGDGAQDGTYTDGAAGVGGRAWLDGRNDKVKFFSDAFQLDRGTLEIQFAQAACPKGTQTILSRDSVGQTDGGFRAEVLKDGSIRITHETAGSSTTFQTAAGFLAAGDEVNLSYSWDVASGGQVVIKNVTAGTSFSDDTPAGLTMDMGDINQKWMVGAGQSHSDPYLLNNLDSYFKGSVEYFQISDSVDNIGPPSSTSDGYVDGTAGSDLIDINYTGDPDGDRIDNADAVLPGAGPNDDYVRAGAGNDTVYAGIGNDVVEGGTGHDLLDGGEGDDLLDGGAGNDRLYGGRGNDTLLGGAGSDQAFGGNGDDYIDTRSGVPLPDRGYPGLYPADSDPFDDRDTVYGGAGNDTILTGDDNDLIYGGSGADAINAGVDDDTVYGGDGNDTIVGGEGADFVDGGTGNDLIYGGLSPDFPDNVNIPDAEGDLRPDNGRDTLLGGSGNDTIYGLDDNDLILGEGGDDVLFGGVDNDTVFGGTGNDTITGGQGADLLVGGADRDVFLVGSAGDGIGDEIDGSEDGDDFDTLDLTGAGPLTVTYADDNPENGFVSFLDADGIETGRLNFRNIENVITDGPICFTPGTLIATPKGEVPVESLKPGDKIITRDNGIQEIRWFGTKHLDWATLCANPHMKPVLIRKGSLGNGLPEEDMLVSPNHRMLVANDRTALYFEEHEVLVAAKHLVGARGIHAVDSAGTTYIHFMFDSHEVVLANGAWTESFQPGDFSLKGLGNAQRNEIFELFPDLRTEAGVGAYGAARKTLKKHEANLLYQR